MTKSQSSRSTTTDTGAVSYIPASTSASPIADEATQAVDVSSDVEIIRVNTGTKTISVTFNPVATRQRSVLRRITRKFR